MALSDSGSMDLFLRAEGLVVTADLLSRWSLHFKSAMGRIRCGEFLAHLLELRCQGTNLRFLLRNCAVLFLHYAILFFHRAMLF